MRLYKKGDIVDWHESTLIHYKGIVIADQISKNNKVKILWTLPGGANYDAEYNSNFLKLITIPNHVWVVEVYKNSKWIPLAALTTRSSACFVKSAYGYKKRIRKYTDNKE
jgi:hypothetical protein